MVSFNELRRRILEKNRGALFLRSDLYIPVAPVNKVSARIAGIFHESKLDIVGLVSHNLKEVKQSLKLIEKIVSQGSQIYALLGFRLEIPWPNENIGILVLYEAAHSDYKIKKLLEHLAYDEKKKQATKDLSIRKIIELIHSDDGMAFYSPANSDDIRSLYENKRLFLSLKEDGYDGIETDDITIPEQLERMKDEAEHPNIPVFISSRSGSIDHLGKQYTLLKAPRANYAGIKGAMKDGVSRIRYPGELSHAFHKVKGMAVEGNFFRDEVFHFNSNLNCVLGGKGTGKTAIIELLRFAFNLSSPEDIKKYYMRNEAEFLSFLLDDGVVRVWIENKQGRSFMIVRSLQDEETRIFTQNGEEITANIAAGEMFALDILGWSEIEFRAQNPRELLKMLDLSREETKNKKHEIGILKKEIYNLGQQLVSIRHDGAQNLKHLKELLGKKEELDALKKTEFSQLVENYEVRYKREFLLDKYIQKMIKLEEIFKGYFQEEALQQFEKQFPRLTSPFVPEINQLLHEIKQRFAKNTTIARKNIDEFLSESGEFNEYLMSRKSRLLELNEKEKKANIREKKKHGKELQKVITKLSSLAMAVNSIPEVKQKQLHIQEQYVELRQEISKKVLHLKTLLTEQRQLRKDIQKFINSELGPDIKMSFVPYHQTSSIQEFMNTVCDDADDSKLLDILKSGMKTLGEDLVQLLDFNWINEGDEMSKAMALNANDVKSVRGFLIKRYAALIELATQEIDCLPRLYFRDKPVHQLSSGQRCTTVLPVLFLLGNHPLIIDQPEDNLDNAYIFNQIVQPIRKKLKGHRQIILVTHNPNIPVSGDAEKIFLMEADDVNGWVKEGGYLDEGKMPLEIQKILEGGKEAFGLRLQKYGY